MCSASIHTTSIGGENWRRFELLEDRIEFRDVFGAFLDHAVVVVEEGEGINSGAEKVL